MYYVITYDIPEPYDHIRNKLARLIMDYGFDRIQKSVFLGKARYDTVENLAIEIEKVLGEIDADVRIFPMCSTCFSKVVVVRASGTDIRTPLVPEKEIVVVV